MDKLCQITIRQQNGGKMDNTVYVELGKKIREARDKKGWTQQELSERVNLTRSSITNIENGKQKIQIDDLYFFASVLEVGILDLLPADNVVMDRIALPVVKQKLNTYNEDILNFTKKIYVKSKRSEGGK